MDRRWARTPRPNPRNVVVVAFSFSLILAAPLKMFPQGTTTAAIRGTVRVDGGAAGGEARIQIVNIPTGYAVETRTRNGIYFVQGLIPGGPYTIAASSLGYARQTIAGITLRLGEQRAIDFTLIPVAGQLDTITVSADRDSRTASAGGVGTFVSDSALHRLPTLNRDLYDFVRLVPQAGTHFGLTGGGASFRYNNYLIDGISDRQLQGNNVMGGSAVGGKTISIEAVKEVQVLLSPYDARYGDFTGMVVNAVTKSGTNALHGSAYGYARNENLARQNSFVGDSPYRREQFGLSLGGPVVPNRAHFFIAPEFQHATAPTPGPYVGQDPDALPALPVLPGDVARFSSLLRDKGLDAGDGSRVLALNPAMTLFGRVDIALSGWKSRAVLVENYSNVGVTRFLRTGQVFNLTSNAFTSGTDKQSSAFQVFTQLSNSTFNEFVLAFLDRGADAKDYTPAPTVIVNVPSPGGGSAQLVAGPPAPAGSIGFASGLWEIADHLLFQVGVHHAVGIGIKAEIFSYHAVGVRGMYGQWRFPSIDALANGNDAQYSITKDFGSGESPVRGFQPSLYVTDDWRIGRDFLVTLGLRSDDLRFSSKPVYNPEVDSIYHRRTSDYPLSHVEWSPRFGFNWTPSGHKGTHIRGGAGLFAGPPPLGWLLGPVRSNGQGVRTLSCAAGNLPNFTIDPAAQPQLCANGKDFSAGPVALVDRNLRMAKSFRTSLALEHNLPWNVAASVEGLYSRVRSDFLFVNADLKGPQGADAHGRVLYGALDGFGQLKTAYVKSPRPFTEVIDLRNHSLGYSWSVTGQLDRSFEDRLEVHAAYTRSRTRDVQSLITSSAVSPLDIWAGGRPLSGKHEELATGISSFEIPNRVVLAATYAAPWKRYKTDLSFYYIGESGTPFTYNDSTSTGLGDLNFDGSNANDPIYVPRDATNPSEIVFDSVAQGAAFEKFISDTPCLRRQRGKIAGRNSCRGSWVNTSNASLRQSLQATGNHDLSLQVEVFNVLNLLNSSWGLFRVPNDKILQQTGQTRTAPVQPTFFFDAKAARTSTQNVESGYQLQISLRYSF